MMRMTVYHTQQRKGTSNTPTLNTKCKSTRQPSHGLDMHFVTITEGTIANTPYSLRHAVLTELRMHLQSTEAPRLLLLVGKQ